ncbi:acyltransferase family protein [Alteribacillus sp. YIM 98480]|uniref:acyltransferase family protein n=1 Tax=Alteribacillus sp. YIM 98480 TaxID=2606599 RepID=UPI00131E27F0|nr:acyltransferase family protein [Alteribacillus sp. YIM 98480]
MKKERVINEIFWIRALACLAVVVIHSVNTTLNNYGSVISQTDNHLLISVRFAVFFGTPAFVFISEMLLAHVYPENLPQGFFRKRIKYLLFPFIFVGIIFAFIMNDTWSEIGTGIFLNVFAGNYTGYFILVIFQFYILHYFFHRHLKKWEPKTVLIFSLLINIAYLSVFNFTEAPGNLIADYIWERGYWLVFFGWVFYFTLGYYCGVNYHSLKKKLLAYKWLVLLLPMISLLTVFILTRAEVLDVVSSKRVDNIFYTVSIIFLIILLTSRLQSVPKWVSFISKYSFNIYLLHKVFLYYLPVIEGMSPLMYFIAAFAFAVGSSVVASWFVSSFNWSSYFIGKTLPVPYQIKNNSKWQNMYKQKI